MLTIHPPGKQPFEIEFILIDFQGTLASDRRVHPKAKDKINLLSKRTKIYILTMGSGEDVENALRKIKAEAVFLKEAEGSLRKLELLEQLGKDRTVVIGNGLDDSSVLREARLGICVLGREGAAGIALRDADVVVASIFDALDFLLKPLRQRATLGT